jgi:uncharacterized protein YbaA (DUF1428 family)
MPTFNAFIVSWSMDRYADLKTALSAAGIVFERADDTEHIRLAVPYDRVEEFAALVQSHLNAAVNYVDVQYPDRKTAVIIFRGAMHTLTNHEESERLKAWAIERGLPPDQADWATSF